MPKKKAEVPTKKKVEVEAKQSSAKRAYISQSDVPSNSLEDALQVAQAIADNFGAKPTPPHEVAIALGISPTSSTWNVLPGASLAYGLTTGGGKASQIAIAELGKRIVVPEDEDGIAPAKLEASLRPRILREFYERYNKAKFPPENIAKNVLMGMGVAKEKTHEVYQIVLANGKYTGIIQDTKTGPFVYLDRIRSQALVQPKDEISKAEPADNNDEDEMPEELAKKLDLHKDKPSVLKDMADFNVKPKVFISHGKNKKIVEQLKEILSFGQFEVVVSVEKESLAISVPEKVFTDMRACNAAVIHVEGELELLDKEGNVHNTLNQNVLIEIGAAMALYEKKFVLLCESSLKLPSNLQGLYRCNYDGKELNYGATMKLLKAFNDFRKG